jgi:hypothetical protein
MSRVISSLVFGLITRMRIELLSVSRHVQRELRT